MRTALVKTPVGVALLAVVVLHVGSGCSRNEGRGGAAPSVGKQVTVQFRRDALGQAANVVTAPTVDVMNGGSTSLSGTLVAADDGWLLLSYVPNVARTIGGKPEEQKPRYMHIPLAVVLGVVTDG